MRGDLLEDVCNILLEQGFQSSSQTIIIEVRCLKFLPKKQAYGLIAEELGRQVEGPRGEAQCVENHCLGRLANRDFPLLLWKEGVYRLDYLDLVTYTSHDPQMIQTLRAIQPYLLTLAMTLLTMKSIHFSYLFR